MLKCRECSDFRQTACDGTGCVGSEQLKCAFNGCKKRKGHWKSKWGRADLSGIHDEDLTAIVALEAFSDLDHEITLSENTFFMLWTDRMPHRQAFSQGRA